MVLKTPVRCPQANAFCRRLIGTIRREGLDWLIVLNERHRRFVLREWVVHFAGRHGRPGPGLRPTTGGMPIESMYLVNLKALPRPTLGVSSGRAPRHAAPPL
jgi:putative transposase